MAHAEQRRVPQLTKDYLNGLPEDHKIRYDLNGGIEKYTSLMNSFRMLCCGISKEEVLQIDQVSRIPKTVVGDLHKVFLVVIDTFFENCRLKLDLLFIKKNGYHIARQRDGEWEEVIGSDFPIKDAKSLNHNGSYVNLGRKGKTGGKGLREASIKIGLYHLFQSLLRSARGKDSFLDFATICIHIPEPARSPKVCEKICPLMEYSYFNDDVLDDYSKNVINTWKKRGVAISKYQVALLEANDDPTNEEKENLLKTAKEDMEFYLQKEEKEGSVDETLENPEALCAMILLTT